MFIQISRIIIRVILVFSIGFMVGHYKHPYEECERKGISPDDIAECVWLLKNQPALR